MRNPATTRAARTAAAAIPTTTGVAVFCPSPTSRGMNGDCGFDSTAAPGAASSRGGGASLASFGSTASGSAAGADTLLGLSEVETPATGVPPVDD